MADGRMLKKRRLISILIRWQIIIRDNCTCQHCGKQGEFIFRYGKPTVVENPKNLLLKKRKFYNGREVIPFHFDHIINVFEGGKNHIDNLQLSCCRCNCSKGARDGNRSRKRV